MIPERYAQRLALLLTVSLTAVTVRGQATTVNTSPVSAALPAYDVVSVKPDVSDSQMVSVQENRGSYHATNVPLRNLISNAYAIREGLISGLPGWAETARFDLNAKITDTSPESLKRLTPEQRQAMLAAILVDRFGLKTHLETKILPVYELILSKGGPRLEQSRALSMSADASESPGHPRPGGMMVQDNNLVATAVPISRLVELLAANLDRTVLDKTGLSGTYDLHLKWTPEDQQAGATQNGASGDPPPALFTALQEQLGLRLVAAKGPVSTLVVDQVAKPSAN